MMDASLALERFIYLGTLLPYYVHKKEPVKIALSTQINELVAQLSGDAYIKIVEKCLKNENLPRKDELWFTYAAFLIHSTIKPDDKKLLKQAFPANAKTSEDLFMFAKYAKDLLNKINRRCFINSIRDTIKLWYAAQDTTKLIEMIGINRGMHTFQHKDLISLCHINLKSIGKGSIEKYIFTTCKSYVKDNEKNDQQLSNPIKNLYDVCKSKITTDPNIVKEYIKENKIKYEHVPKKLLRRADIWEALLPTLSYRYLLTNVHYIIETKMLGNVSFKKAYFAALKNSALISREKLHPILFLIELNKQTKRARYSEKIKQSYHTIKLQKFAIQPNTAVNNKLTKLFDLSFNNIQPIGLRILITINLQENYKTKTVWNQKQITCMEAAITLAFSYFKSENFVTVWTFGSIISRLKKIEWEKDFNYTKANEACEKLIAKHNYQNLILPILQAVSKSEQHDYDLFLTIVPSAARCNPSFKSTSLIEKLKAYREAKNKNARMVIVNLRRFKPAMIHQSSEDDGILEICGFNENTPKLINSFALNNFS